MNITEAIETFVAKNQEAMDAYRAKHFPNNERSVLEIKEATKYFKVWVNRYGRSESIHAFIDKVSGDILMPAGINKPAKHARGNVFVNNGINAFSENGFIRYLK